MAVAAPDRTAEWAAAGEGVTDYARAVVAGEVMAGEKVRRACQRHLDDLEFGGLRGLHFDAVEAGWSILFFPTMLRHYKGEWGPIPGVRDQGMPIMLEPWQQFIVGSIFGWKRADGLRRFRSVFIEIGKKNGKTLMAAGIGLRGAFFDEEPAAEVYTAATKREQAKLPWNDARAMVERSPSMKSRIKGWEPRTTVANLWDAVSASFFRPLSAEAGGEEGINPHIIIIDELHRAVDRSLVDMLQQSTGARRQPMVVKITTAGQVGESIWSEEHDYAERVVIGMVEDDATFAYIANLDDDDDPFDESVWPKANPNLGVSVRVDELRQRANEAKEAPGKLASFLRLRMNRRTDEVRKGLVSIEVWKQNDAIPHPKAHALAYGGLDLASRLDLTAFSLLFPDGAYLDWLAWFWMPETVYGERQKAGREPYDVWVREGWIRVTEGNVVDYDRVRDDIVDICSGYDVREIGYDPWNAAQIVGQLAERGAKMIEVRQGYATLSTPLKEIERRLVDRKVRHGNNPVLRWMNGNVAVRSDPAGNVKLDRDRSTEKIDGIASGVTALARLMVAPPPRVKRPATVRAL